MNQQNHSWMIFAGLFGCLVLVMVIHPGLIYSSRGASSSDVGKPIVSPTQFVISPQAVNFGYQLVGTTSRQTVLHFTNPTTAPVIISEIALIGNDWADFNAIYDFSVPVALAPGDEAAIKLEFTPSAPWRKGSRDAKLRIKTDDGNQFVTLTGIGATCGGPVSACDSGGLCADTDGDGFNDVWEDNDYIDLNNNGKPDKDDFFFPHSGAYTFSTVSHSGLGRGQMFLTVSDSTQPVQSSAVKITVNSSGDLNQAAFTYTVNGGAAQGPILIRPVVDLGGNLRAMFYLNNFIAGDTYEFTTAMGPDTKIADKDRPNIYVQYDYMDWAEPGAACTSDGDCANPNDVCHQGFCNHNHAPGDPLFRKVVDQFAAHGLTLYIDPVHQVVPHAQVITWSQQGDGTSGATTSCAGADVIKGNIGPGQFAVNFHDIKNRPGSEFAAQPARKNIYHYTVFSHFATCLQDGDGDGDCSKCPTDRAMPPGTPTSGISGTAELPGNDFIVAMGDRWYIAKVSRTPFDEQGAFMHELGHNLGLHHAGDNANYELAPNYLSVMNNKYVFSGIQHAATPGSTVAIESLREVNYSEHILNALDERHLDEQAGVSPLSAGYTGIVRFFNFAGGNGAGPESGPIDWDGLPQQLCVSNADCEAGPSSFTGLCLPSGYCEVRSDLNKDGILRMVNGYSDWIHGPCLATSDCRINLIRQQIHDRIDPTVNPHESCVRSRCQSLWFPFQCTQWGKAD